MAKTANMRNLVKSRCTTTTAFVAISVGAAKNMDNLVASAFTAKTALTAILVDAAKTAFIINTEKKAETKTNSDIDMYTKYDKLRICTKYDLSCEDIKNGKNDEYGEYSMFSKYGDNTSDGDFGE